ncbi:hypothetical protein E4T52_13839 [Aureobasidium sp. EXF-3400]|nr:hypothetical protein E4T51_12880 [Aureobasidium sp. EXF-12344]KAI4771153.1 hypothetical protein E4T52_13839 [Aureobasidium sp. EXF-3400]
MGLEATMIVVDNSESSRNGDYVPSRWDAQADAANLIFQYKTQANPESSVGLMTMGATGPEVLTTLTTNPAKILDGLHRTKIRGESHLHTAIMIASLALKHRQNKSQRQRIIVLTCSPLNSAQESQSSLVKLAKRMKKNNVSIDIVAFGDLSDDVVSKLQAFNEAVKGGDGSYLEIVQPGPNLLSDTIVASPILAGETGGMGGSSAGGEGGAPASGGGDFEFGVDPSMDPELALALRMSMEEETARQARANTSTEGADGKTQLESVPETSESQPLLDQSGNPSGSGESKDDKKKDGDDDKMDIA